jgi:uncharacterized LabA/DUF88 family protein
MPGPGNAAFHPQPPTKYIFIDGGCLKSTLLDIEKRYSPERPLQVDYEILTAGFNKVFYYDALPSKHSAENADAYEERLEAAIQFHDKLGALDRFHVYEGDTRRSPSLRRQEQKKVDVMITVDMLTHAFRSNMQEATLLTGDLDFKPLLDALVNDGMFVTLWYPPKKTNRGLISSADQRRLLNVQSIYSSLKPRNHLPFTLPIGSGLPYEGDRGETIETWLADGDEFKLSKDGLAFVISGPNPNQGYRTYYQHHDQTLLRKFAQDVLQAPDSLV